MKKSVLAVVIALVAVAVLGFIVFAGNDDDTDQPAESPDSSSTQTQDTNTTESNGQDEQATEPSGEEATNASAVTIEDFAYSPASITVKKGTTVTWTNQDSVDHTVTPDNETSGFEGSALFGQGETYSYTFNTVGTYAYHCQPHPQMEGTVVVTE